MRSALLALSHIRFTTQFDFAVSDIQIYSYEKIHTASLGTASFTDVSTYHHIEPRLKARACAEMSPSHLPKVVCMHRKTSILDLFGLYSTTLTSTNYSTNTDGLHFQ